MDKQWPCQVDVDLKAVGYDCRLTCCFWASNGFANMSNTMRFISLIMPKLGWELYGLHHFIGWIWPMCHCLRLMAASCLQFHFLCERYHCYRACLSQYNSTRYTFQTMLCSWNLTMVALLFLFCAPSSSCTLQVYICEAWWILLK